jgi:hypothetical protein
MQPRKGRGCEKPRSILALSVGMTSSRTLQLDNLVPTVKNQEYDDGSAAGVNSAMAFYSPSQPDEPDVRRKKGE